MDNIKVAQIGKSVKSMYDKVPYVSFGIDFSPVFKSLRNTKIFDKKGEAMEVGCGGGQLSFYMSKFFNSIEAVDFSKKSLILANEIAKKENILNINFSEENLFDDNFVKKNIKKYDYILCYGVLHHTANPEGGFTNLVKMLKPGGYITIGLYSNTQLSYKLKRKIVNLFAKNNAKKKERIAEKLFFRKKYDKKLIYDGFVHPQVSFHSINKTYKWLNKNGLVYIGSWPPIEISYYFRLLFSRTNNKVRKDIKFNFLNYNSFCFYLVELIWILSNKQVMLSISAKKIIY